MSFRGVRPDRVLAALIIVDTDDEPRPLKIGGEILSINSEEKSLIILVPDDDNSNDSSGGLEPLPDDRPDIAREVCVLASDARIFAIIVSDDPEGDFEPELIDFEDLEVGMDIDAFGQFESTDDKGVVDPGGDGDGDGNGDEPCFVADEIITGAPSTEPGDGDGTDPPIVD